MEHLSRLERSVLETLVAGSGEGLERLRRQLAMCRVASRELTGVGFYTHLFVDESAPRLSVPPGTIRFGDVVADIGGLRHGAGFLVYVKDGALEMLEGYSFDEPWPKEIGDVTVRYVNPARRELPNELTQA